MFTGRHFRRQGQRGHQLPYVAPESGRSADDPVVVRGDAATLFTVIKLPRLDNRALHFRLFLDSFADFLAHALPIQPVVLVPSVLAKVIFVYYIATKHPLLP